MHVLERVLIFSVSVLSAAFLFSSVAGGQVPRDTYRFLEVQVIDSSGKPVKDAAFDFSGKPLAEATDEIGRYEEGKLKTDQSGRLETSLPSYLKGLDREIGFTVLKPGYFPFTDYFGIISRNWSDPVKIELLFVPQTNAERKAVGREQEKRELFGAAKMDDAAAVRKLLRIGLDPNLTTTDLRGVPAECDVPVFVYAATSGDGETIAEFLRAGADAHRKDESTRRILVSYLNADPLTRHYSDAETEKAKRIKAFETGAENLIKAGADINPANAGEATTLMTAATKGYVRIARLLIAKGVPVNAKDKCGNTALMYAVNDSRLSKTRYEMMNLLLESGADINAATNDGNYYYGCETALKYAVRNGDLGAVELLVKNKAAVNSTCGNSQTALELAKSMLAGIYENEVRQIIKLLEAAGAK